jgi:hypothetical protein
MTEDSTDGLRKVFPGNDAGYQQAIMTIVRFACGAEVARRGKWRGSEAGRATQPVWLNPVRDTEAGIAAAGYGQVFTRRRP